MPFPRHPLIASALLACSLFLVFAPAAHADTVMMKVSTADNAKAYRMDAARHIYAVYPEKIYKGKLPPLVHAIVVLEMELDANGQLRRIDLIRVPTHAPEVTEAVTQMIRKASPMPAPMRMGGARFTEIWLVDKSGRFQLDALTEGQR
jgi:protein TonB